MRVQMTKDDAAEGDSAVVCWNFHRHEISAADRDAILAQLNADLSQARRSPTHFIVIVAGDFNYYDAEDDVAFVDPVKQKLHEDGLDRSA
eukprot:10074774-Karenia_brevis.AAC.1